MHAHPHGIHVASLCRAAAPSAAAHWYLTATHAHTFPCTRAVAIELWLIVGKGLHSEGGQGVLGPAIMVRTDGPPPPLFPPAP